MKTTLSIIAAIAVVVGVITAKQIHLGEKQTSNKAAHSEAGINQNGFLASEFIEFKKDFMYKDLCEGNLTKNLYSQNNVSDKVLFKLFVKYKTGKFCK